jgi:hypothetical protein
MEDFIPITPVNFFQMQIECHHVESGFPKITGSKKGKFLLPDTTDLCNDFPFAEMGMGWNREGIELLADIGVPYRQIHYPDVVRGDSVELFFDTRDVKTAGFNTRFCHHFFFLPEEVEGHQAGEITRFRTEDAHELCDSAELKVKAQLKHASYQLQIFIPAHCLFGYDPDQFDRLGFTYRVNRAGGPPQHFCVVTDDYQIDQQPALWSSVKLVK